MSDQHSQQSKEDKWEWRALTDEQVLVMRQFVPDNQTRPGIDVDDHGRSETVYALPESGIYHVVGEDHFGHEKPRTCTTDKLTPKVLPAATALATIIANYTLDVRQFNFHSRDLARWTVTLKNRTTMGATAYLRRRRGELNVWLKCWATTVRDAGYSINFVTDATGLESPYIISRQAELDSESELEQNTTIDDNGFSPLRASLPERDQADDDQGPPRPDRAAKAAKLSPENRNFL